MSAPTHSTSRRADASAMAVALVLPTLVAWVYFVLLAEEPPALQRTVYALVKTVQFGFPLVWVLAVQRRRLAWKRPGSAGLAQGLVFGVLIFAAALALYHGWLKPAGHLVDAAEPISQKLKGFGLTSAARYAAFAAFVSLAHSFLEEYYWRWFVFGGLRKLMPWKTAMVVSSVGFMGHHVIILATYFGWSSVATPGFCLGVAAGGIVWAWIYHRSNSLYGVWLSHLIVDVAIMVVGYDLARPFFNS